MTRRRLLIPIILAAPLWVLLALIGYQLSQTRKALDELNRMEVGAYENAHRELEALREEMRRSRTQQLRALEELEKEIDTR